MTVATGMARGIVVLDENLEDIKPELQKRNIKVVSPIKGIDDDHIAESLAPGRILVTNNTAGFLNLAVEFEFGIIGTEHASKDPRHLAKQISDSIITHGLWAKKNPFLVTLLADGGSKYRDLSEPQA